MAANEGALISNLHHEETSSWVKVVGVVIFTFCLSNIFTILITLTVPRFQKVINFFLLSLAVADIIIGNICMPLTIAEQMGAYEFGAQMCMILPFVQGVSVTAEMWTRVAISIERYCAIVHPLRSIQFQNKKHVIKTLIWIWALSLFISIPTLFVTKLEQNEEASQCRQIWASEGWKRAYNLFQLIGCFVIPFFVVTFACLLICRKLRERTKNERNRIELNTIANFDVTTTCSEEEDTEKDISWASRPPVKSQGDQKTDQNTEDRTPHLPGGDSVSTSLRSTHVAQNIAAEERAPRSPIKSQADQKMGQNTENRTPRLSGVDSVSTSLRSTHDAQNIAAEKRILLMLSIIVGEFFICWMPLHYSNMYYLNEPTRGPTDHRVLLVAQFMGYVSTCFNPVVYYFMNKNFQEFLVRIVR